MAKRKKVVVINKEDIKRGFEEIKKESSRMGRHITSDADKIKDAFDSLSKRAKGALNEGFGESSGLKTLNDVNEALQNQRAIVNDLEVQLRKAKAEFDSVNIGTANPALIAKKKQASTAFKEARVELDLENQQLEKQEKAFKILSTELSSVTQKSVSFTTQMRNIRDEMREMALDGKSNTPEYEALRVKLDEVAIAYNKVADEQRMMTKHGSLLIPGMMQGLTGLAGGFSAYHGAVGLFTKDNERLMEIQTKIQGAMSITMGLQQVNQTLLVNSAFRVGVVEKVTKSWTVAQNALNTSLGISKGLAGAFMTGGILALVAGVGYVVTSYRKWAREQERLKIIQEDFNKTMLAGAKNAQKDIVNLDFLYKATQDHNRSQAERLKAAKELQKLYPDYLGNLSEEQILAGKGADAYNNQAEAIIKVARAQAAKDKIYENEKKRLELQDELEKATKKQVQAERDLAFALKSTEGYGALNGDGTGVMTSTLALNNVKNKISSLYKQIEDIDSLNEKLKDGINIDDWINESSSSGGNKSKDRAISILDDIENARYNLTKQATQDKLELLKLEEEQELKSINKKYENANISEEQKKELIDLTHEYYKLKAKQIQEEELKKEQDRLQKEQEARDKSLEAFEAYEVQKQAIIDKYAELRKNATEKHDVSLIDKAEKEELEGLSDKFFPKKDVQLKTLDLTRASTKQLKEELENLRERIKDATDPKDVQALQDRINATLHTLENKTPFSIFKSNLKDALKDGKVDFELLGNAISGLVPELQGIANDARALFGDGVGDSLDGFVQSIDGLSDLSKSIGSFASGDVLGGVSGLLSAGNKLFGNARKVNAEHREALHLLKLQKEEIQHQLAIAELRSKLESKNGIFGSDNWGQALRNADAYKQALNKINEATKRNNKNEEEIARLQGIRDSSNNRLQKIALENQINKLQREQLSNLEKIEVVTGSRKSGWGPWKKRKDVWSPITELEEYDQLFDEVTGKVDVKLAQQILNNKKMSDESKASLQHLIDNAQVMEDAMSQIASNLRDIFGELGQTIMDYFEEAARSGVNDFSKVEEAGSKMVERLAKEMIFSVLLGDLIDEYTEKMKATQISDKSDDEKLLDFQKITEDFIAGGLATQGKYEELINNLKDGGINISDSDKQDTSRGVQRNVSQDTMDEVNGRLTAVQISNESIAESTRIMAESSRRSIETMSSISSMMQIGTYAWQDIANYTSVLPGMAKDMAEVKRNTRGLIK